VYRLQFSTFAPVLLSSGRGDEGEDFLFCPPHQFHLIKIKWQLSMLKYTPALQANTYTGVPT